MPYRLNATDDVVLPASHERLGPGPGRRAAGRVLGAEAEPIDPALYSRAEAPMGAVRT